MLLQVDDILAALLMALASLRRLEAKSAPAQQNAHVPESVFSAWQRAAIRAYSLAAGAAAAKIGLNVLWRFLAAGKVSSAVYQAGGVAIFAAWIVATVVAWRRATDARSLRFEHSISLRRPRPRSPA